MITLRDKTYTSKLGAGLGMIEETRILLDLWNEGMDSSALNSAALNSGRFPGISARRLRNLIMDCFAPRYLVNGATPALMLKALGRALSSREYEQLMFLFTCRAHVILADFVRDVYWPAYASGHDTLNNDEARVFVVQANQDGKTSAPWSDTTIQNVAGYLTGCCADFGLLERGVRRVRRILPYHLEPRVATILGYDLHFTGISDNRVIENEDWALFGLEPADVLAELKRMALKGLVIVQAAGGATWVGWEYKSRGDMTYALAQGAL